MNNNFKFPSPKTTVPSEKKAQRMLEVIPAILTWSTLIGMVVFSYLVPVWMAVFIIAFDIYWIHRTIFISYYSVKAYLQLKEGKRIDWFERCSHVNEVEDYKQEIAKRIVDNENLLAMIHRKKYKKELKQAIDSDRKFLQELKKINGEDVMDWRDIIHVVALPTAIENAENIDPAIKSIQNSIFPNEQIIILLATEERENEEKRMKKVNFLKEKYDGVFQDFIVTTHEVADGEMKCKASNMTYAAKKLQKYFDEKNIDYERIMLSNFDCETITHSQFLAALTYAYITEPDRLKRAYQPIPLYHNNIWDTNAFVRVIVTSSSFWHMFQTTRKEMVTFSSHSEPFATLVKFDFWPVNMISEDSIIYWKGYSYYNSEYYVRPIHLPVSMDAVLAETYWETLKNQYKQKRRWAYGIENFPIIMRAIWPNKKIKFYEKLRVAFEMLEGHHSWATAPFILALLGWLPLIFGGSEFNQSTLAHNLPLITRLLMTLAMSGLIVSVALSFFLLPKRPEHHSRKRYIYMMLQWALVPIIAPTLGAMPAIESQTRILFKKYFTEFWVTDKVKKKQ
ncbi:MAG: glycosyltransferase family 2 protein [Candidatus Moranbacteria bacterium]|nr:glycosyltransferase family 2 protein [Candidatus Moranbacteria bacterium]